MYIYDLVSLLHIVQMVAVWRIFFDSMIDRLGR